MPASPNCIVKHREPISKINLSRKSVKESKVELCEYKNDVFIKVVADHETDSSVTPSAMNKEHFL
jgi:hypothetical protein